MNPALYRLEEEISREQLIDELEATPGRVRELLEGRERSSLTRKTSTDEWTALEVCKHMRDAAQVYGMRFKWMILNDDPLLPNYDEDRWVAESPDGVHDVVRIADEMGAYRAETVRLLRSLPPRAWSRTGRHEVLGHVMLEDYVRHEVEHERQHLAQLQRALT